jgi:Holliday junction DNA helicase RuvA
VITRVTGTLESLEANTAVILPEGAAGVAYEVMVPAFLSPRLVLALGSTVTLWTLQYLEGQGQGTSFVPRLIGFASVGQREFFELFTTVKGLGNKRALRAMAIEPGWIARAIMARDARSLTELPEIGKRLAETVVAELSGKVERFAAVGEGKSGGSHGGPPVVVTIPGANGTMAANLAHLPAAAADAVGALVSLGQTRADAERAVETVVRREPGLAGTPEILRAALGVR